MKKPHRRMSLATRQGLSGFLFISPWLVGVTVFFLIPFFSTIIYAFGKVQFVSGGVEYEFTGWENIREVFFRDPDNFRMILENLGSSIGGVLLVLVFSLFAALLLNQKFHGRAVVRALFALPIIVSSGVLLMVFKEDLFAQSMMSEPGTIFQSSALEETLTNMGLGHEFVTFVTDFVDNIMDIIWKSGVQILLFLAGLQAVPRTLYEVSSVEGATAWQTFWKITFPLLAPYIVLNSVYSIIDSFTFYDNPVMEKVNKLFGEMSYGHASALSIAYFLLIFLLTATVLAISSRRAFYQEK